MADKTDETVYLNNCEVVVESISFAERGTFFLVWKKGKKSTQTNRYTPTSETPVLSPKEILSLSLKVYHKGNVPQPRYSHLILMSGNGEERGRAQLMISDWTPEFKEQLVKIGEVTIRLRAKRRGVLKLERFHRMRAEVEESSEDESARFLRRNGRRGHNQQDETIRLKKEVEDLNFMVERLKEERTDNLVRIQSLQTELAGVNDRMRKDLGKLREYFALKIEMRESIFKEEIQQLVSSFNSNYDLNREILESMIQEKYMYEDEILELKETNQEYIARQEENLERIIAEMDEQNKIVDEEFKDSNERIREKEETIVELNNALDSLSAEHEKLKNSFITLEGEKSQQFEKFTNEAQERNEKIAELEEAIETDKMTIKQLEEELTAKEDELRYYNEQLELNLKDKNDLETALAQANQQSEETKIELSKRMMDIEQSKQESEAKSMEILGLTQQLEDEKTGRLKQREDMEMSFQEMDNNYKDEIMNLQKQQEDLSTENYTMKLEMTEMNDKIQLMTEELEMERKGAENDKKIMESMAKQNEKTMESLRHHEQDLTQQVTDFMTRNHQLQLQNGQLKIEMEDRIYQSQQQQQILKEEYDRLMESNKQLFEDEMETVKQQMQNDRIEMDNMKLDYEQEIQNMMEHQRTDIEEMEVAYKEEMETKTKEYIQLLQKTSKHVEEYENYRLDAEKRIMELEEQLAILSTNRGLQKRVKQKWGSGSIKELEEENLVDLESEKGDDYGSEDDQFTMALKKKKKKIIKKGALEDEDLEQDEEDSDSFQIPKKKGMKRAPVQDVEEQIEDISDEDLMLVIPPKKKKDKKGLKRKPPTVNEEDEEEAEEVEDNQEMEEVTQFESEQKPKSKKKLKRSDKNIEMQPEELEQSSQYVEPETVVPIAKPKPTKASHDRSQVTSLVQQKEELKQKVSELEQQNSELKRLEKKAKEKLQKEEKKYKGKVLGLEEEVDQLTSQIGLLREQLGDEGSKLQKVQKQLKRKQDERERQKKEEVEADMEAPKPPPKSAKATPARRSREHTPERVQEQVQSPIFEVEQPRRRTPPKEEYARPGISEELFKSQMEQFKNQAQLSKNQIEQLTAMLNERQQRVAQLQMEKQTLQMQASDQSARMAAIEKQKESVVLDSKIMDSRFLSSPHYVQPQQQPANVNLSFGVESAMKASIANLEDKVMNEKERGQEYKMKYEQKMRECEGLETDIKRLKRQFEEVEENYRRRSVPRSAQDMQSQLDEINRKVIESSRAVTQARLERDAFEEELRLVRRKLGQVQKSCQEWESRTGEAEREGDNMKRTEQKLRRETQDLKDDVKRLREQVKRQLDELTESRKSQNEYVLQRKKVLDEVVRLQGVVAQKETELVKQGKEVDRLRGKLNDDTEGKKGREREYRAQIEKLEVERSRHERKGRQLQETIRLLKEKLEAAEKEARRSIDERKQTYGDKLKKYIEEIMSVKAVVESLQEENSTLKIQNNQFFEQNQILKMSFEKLEIKYEEGIEYQGQLTNDIQALQAQLNDVQELLKAKTAEEEKSQLIISTMRKDLDNERVASRRKTEKLQNFQEINERYLYDIKNLKLKVAQYEGNTEDVEKLKNEIYASRQTLDSLQEEFQKVNEEYHDHSNRYVYTRDDMEAALRDLKDHEDKVKEEEISKVIEEIDAKQLETRRNMETELLTLYNENEKMRVSLQKATEDLLQLQIQLREIDTLADAKKRLEQERSLLERRLAQTEEDLKSTREEVRRLEIKFNDSIRNQQGKSSQNVLLQQRYDEIFNRYQELTDSYNELKKEDKRILEKYKAITEDKDANIDQLSSQLQGKASKILGLQLEVKRLKQLQKTTSQDQFKRVKQLEMKISEMSDAHRQKDRETEMNHKAQVRDLKNGLSKYEEELENKLQRIQELNEGVIMLQGEVEEITEELTGARGQLAEEGELYTLELNKLRNQMKDMEETYDQNLRNLEEELSAMSKELTSLKVNRETGNSRLRMSMRSNNGDERNGRRYEEKLKLKDRRIDELKETVIVLEDKLSEMMRKEGKSEQVEELQSRLTTKQREYKEELKKKSLDITRLTQQIKELSNQVMTLKSQEEQLRLIIEERQLQLNSITNEMTTVSKLYSDLQREVERRKETLTSQLKDEAAYKADLEDKDKEINHVNNQLVEAESRVAELELMVKRKTNDIKNVSEKLEVLQREREGLLGAERRKLQGENLVKVRMSELEQQVDSLKSESARLRSELNFALKQVDGLKLELTQKNASLNGLLREVENSDRALASNQNLLNKYVELNETSVNKIGVSLQETVGYAMQLKDSIQIKEDELLRMNDELAELQFLYERNYLDVEQLKRENCELTLRAEQAQIAQNEALEYREKMQISEREKQELVYRQELIKMQLEGVLRGSRRLDGSRVVDGRDLAGRIEGILQERAR